MLKFLFCLIFLSVFVSCGETPSEDENVNTEYSYTEEDIDFLSEFRVSKKDDTFYYTTFVSLKNIDGSTKKSLVTCQAYFDKITKFTDLVESILNKSFFNLSLEDSFPLASVYQFQNNCHDIRSSYRSASMQISDLENDQMVTIETLSLMKEGGPVEDVFKGLELIRITEFKELLISFIAHMYEQPEINTEKVDEFESAMKSDINSNITAIKERIAKAKESYDSTCSAESSMGTITCSLKYYEIAQSYRSKKR